jgi:PhoPQ-activated pathogenicity-related protein
MLKRSLTCLLMPALVACACALAAPAPRTALDTYVAAPDSHYKFELVRTISAKGYTAYVLEMTSQSWRAPAEVDRTVWRHWLTVIKPDTVKSSTGLLFIAGGSNPGAPPSKADSVTASIATDTGTVVAELRMIPNQPLTFSDDRKPRKEDAIIAYTWDKYLRTGDVTWPLQLPMTKAAVRAMDTVTAFCSTALAGHLKIDKFVVAGASKRGWTTWTTAAVDHRVVGIMPLVIDLLNMNQSFRHHWQVYGFWAPAVADYVDMKVMGWVGTRQFHDLTKIVEPYEYRGRFTMPKYLVNAAGDQFFLPDSSQFYFDQLPGEKYLRYVPNADHSLRHSDAIQGVTAFYQALLDAKPRPRFSWRFEKNGAIRVSVVDKPTEVRLWQATNPSTRDFRLQTIGPAYKSSLLTASSRGIYLARVAKPTSGWTAFFVELTFPSGGEFPFKFTTAIRVVPDKLPFPPPAAEAH